MKRSKKKNGILGVISIMRKIWWRTLKMSFGLQKMMKSRRRVEGRGARRLVFQIREEGTWTLLKNKSFIQNRLFYLSVWVNLVAYYKKKAQK